MIPMDVFRARVTAAQEREMVADAVAVHMNTIRVWGGGESVICCIPSKAPAFIPDSIPVSRTVTALPEVLGPAARVLAQVRTPPTASWTPATSWACWFGWRSCAPARCTLATRTSLPRCSLPPM